MKQSDPYDLVDVQAVCPGVQLDVRYATSRNFLGKAVYDRPKCFLRRKVALKLDAVQKRLQKIGLGLKVFDGYRPLSIQKQFWEAMPDPRYIASPDRGSKHNRGAAVDVSLVDQEGIELKMPTDFDDFSLKAHRDYERLPKEVIFNRMLLENVMVESGFIPVESEWWHFDDEEGETYPLEDISFADLDKGNSR
ncbi:MAG: D-alanyl-D-alanine dipeptidase [Verrucomicrobia bacterium]|nr:D-alanyl-D-alanine dipeptidase [Verrucomicrobiota bacterium]